MSDMKVIDVNQRSDEWHKWRAKGITASDIPIILGLSPYKTPWQLWAEKVGLINSPDISDNPNVQRGVRLEDEARQLAENRYGEVLLPVCAECDEWPVLRASFDGLDSQQEPFEFKCPSDSIWEVVERNGVTSSTFEMYQAQVFAQCTVAGTTHGRLIFYREDGSDMDFEINMSPEQRAQVIAAAKDFWQRIQTKTPPKQDPTRDWFIPESGTDVFKWQANSDAWRNTHQKIAELKDQLKQLESEQKELQQSLVGMMGPFLHADVCGVKVTRFTKKGSVDYGTYLKEQYPDYDPELLEHYRRQSREEVRVSSSDDELVNLSLDAVITNTKSAYF